MAYPRQPTSSSVPYQPLPSDAPPAYAPTPSTGASAYPVGYSTTPYDPYKNAQPGPSYPGNDCICAMIMAQLALPNTRISLISHCLYVTCFVAEYTTALVYFAISFCL